MFGRGTRALLLFILGLSLIHLVILAPLTLWALDQAGQLSRGLGWLAVTILLDSLVVSLLFIFSSRVFSDYLATFRRLLRLESLSHPLLVRLSVEAPGTYHHSLNLANLCYAAARSIQADALLVRVGAYYHDIGKLKHPEFFTENQAKSDNPHDALDPRQSAEMIKQHVKGGKALAAAYKLPPEVIAFIAEHHGTTEITYFKHRAKEWVAAGKLEWVRESDFRYDGPKPQSRETAILMLADAIEARARALAEITEPTIREVVEATIEARKTEGELAESHLSDLDLTNLSEAFTNALLPVFHRRISYPKVSVLQQTAKRVMQASKPKHRD